MSINQDITKYGGTVPDKDTQSPSEFNDAADSFVDWMEGLPSEINTWADEANTTADTVNTYKNDAESARDAAQTAETNAETARNYASDWASQDAGTGKVDDGVNTTDYSAKAYAVDDLTGSDGGSSKDWSTTTGGTVDGSEYSAKEYAQGTTASGGTAQQWAQENEDTDITGSNDFSAYHWAQKSAKGERLTATSSSSITIGTGSKTFILVESYRAFTTGSEVRISDGSAPSTNYMEGTVTNYDDTIDELTVDISVTNGSGTISDWYISLKAVGSNVTEAPTDGEHYARKDGSWVKIPKIQQPINQSPSDGATDIGETPTLSADTFNCVLDSDTHASSDWQIYSDSSLSTLVWESVDDTTNLESIDVPSGILSTSTTYYWRVRYTGSTYGDSEWSTATDFTTASSFCPVSIADHGPGPDCSSLDYDPTTDTGFYGETTTSELTDGSTLCSDIGLSAGTLHNDTEPWLKFFVGASADCNPDGVDKVLYIPKKSYRYDLSWDDIYDAGCVYGVDGPGPYNSGSDTNQYTTVTYSGYDFVVRLMTGSENNPASLAQGNTQCDDDVGNASEWNDLMYRLHNLVPDCASPDTGTSDTDYHGGPQEGDNWVSYTDSELNINTGDGRYTWCQEAGNDTSRRVIRGTYGVAYFVTYSSDAANTRHGFRPCLVLVQP